MAFAGNGHGGAVRPHAVTESASPPQGREHKWGPSKVGHGEAQCVWCGCTNREAWVLGMICDRAPPEDTP